jgi:tetratricopeptide (TPR) repeat protein
MAELKLEKWLPAKRAASDALKLDPKNVKALFRRGQANAKQGSLEEAKNDFVSLLQIDPNNSAGKKEYAAVRKRLIAHKETAKKGFGGIFDRAGGMYDDREQEQLLAKQKKEEEEARLYKLYDDEMKQKEEDFNVQQDEACVVDNPTSTSDESSEITDESTLESKEVAKEEEEKKKKTFERVSFDQWKKDREKKQKDDEKAKEKQKEAE